jgi:predicted Fe-Mo cluster-binding NifX family protein
VDFKEGIDEMKIGISATEKTLEGIMDQRFGRTAFFLIADSETMQFKAIDNTAASAGGAGITAAQMMVDKGVQAVVTGNVGPNAISVLNAAGIPVYRGKSASVRQNIEEFQKGTLEKIDTAVPAHFGIGAGNPK